MNFPIQDFVREFLTDYGTPYGINVRFDKSENIEIVPQKYFDCPSGLGLFATNPSLPLLPPNNYGNVAKDPCMEDKIRCEGNLRNLIRHYRGDKTMTKKPVGKLRLEELLDQLEKLGDLDDDFKVNEFYEHLRANRKAKVGRYKAFEVSTYTADLRGQFLEFDVNSDYTGGCVSYLPYDSCTRDGPAGILVYPRGRNLSRLCFSYVSVAGDRVQLQDPSCEVDLADDEIVFESKIASTQQQTFAMCRQRQRCSIFRLDNYEHASKPSAHLVMSHEWSLDDRPSSISLSPYIASESLVSTRSGSVYLWSLRSKDQAPVRVYKGDDSLSSWTGCHFGGHPRLAVVANRTSVVLHDIGSSRLCTELLHMPHHSFHPDERVMAAAKCYSPFYHLVATDGHVVLLDERKPNVPVLLWRPWFFSPPQYLNVVPGVLSSPAVDDLFLVGTQQTAETFCFQVHPQRDGPDGEFPWQACGNYWRAAKTDCVANFAAKQGHGRYRCVTTSRLKAPLAGVCAIPHGLKGKRTGLSVIQMTSFGDLFCQDFVVGKNEKSKEKTFSSGPGSASISVSDDVLTDFGQWLDKARLQLDNRTRKEVPIDSTGIGVGQMFRAILPKHTPFAACRVCNRHFEDFTASESAIADNEVCLSCRISVTDSRSIVDCIEKNCAASMPNCETSASGLGFPNVVAAIQLENHTDPESEILRKLLNNETDLHDALVKREEEDTKLLNLLSQNKSSSSQKPSNKHGGDVEESNPDVISGGRPSPCSSLSDLNMGDEGCWRSTQNQPPAKRARLDSSRSLFSSASSNSNSPNKPSATPRRQRNPSNCSVRSTSSIHSVLVNTPGFCVTPKRLQNPPAPSLSSLNFGFGPSLMDSICTPVEIFPPSAKQSKAPAKQKEYNMGF